MEIYTVAGFDNIDSQPIAGRKERKKKRAEKKAARKEKRAAKKKARKAKRAERKAKRKEKVKKLVGKVKAGAKKLGKALKKVGIAPARGAFLSLILINARGLASKIAKIDPDKVKSTWEKFGGNYDKLMKAVNKGKAKKPFLGEKASVEGIGSVVAVGTLLASAAPIIIAVTKLFKSDGAGDSEELSDLEELANEASVAYEEGTGESAEEMAKGVVKAKTVKKGEAGGDDEEDEEDEEESGGGLLSNLSLSPTTIGLGVAAAAGLYFLTKKNK